MRVLLVEDDAGVANAFAGALTRQGYSVVPVRTGAEALEASPVDIVLLDMGLPDMDGLDVCRALRSRGGVPVIAVTARGEQQDRVRGLRTGADDYIVKPFGMAELLARMEAVLRRSAQVPAEAAQVARVDGLEVDLGARTVTVAGAAVALTRKEFDVLAMLAREPGTVVPRGRIVLEVWGTSYEGSSRTLDVHVATLRSKLGRPDLVETVRGVGYRLAVPDQEG